MRLLEIVLWIAGITLIAIYIAVNAWAESEGRRRVAGFVEAQHRVPLLVPDLKRPAISAASSDIEDSPSKLEVVAVLRIPGIKLVVPVMVGTEESVLRRGAGVIEGTAMPGTRGNVALAAHRDTFFRGLENIALGDQIELDTFGRTQNYRITALSVVEPADVYVLADVGDSVLTLVTCYPFYFVGHAPQRFIVRAEAADPST
jgi:sortase A